MARPSSPVFRTNVFDTAELVTPVWKFTPSAIWSTITLFVICDVVHRAVEPDADLGVLDVEAVDRRVAQRAADAVDLVGVDALAHVAADGEPGQVHVVAAADGRVLAVEADAGVHGAVGCGRRERDLRAADDRVPAAGALDRDVVDDDVPVHLEDARRHVDRQVLPSCANAIALSNASAESLRPNGSAPKSSTLAALSLTSADRPARSRAGRRRSRPRRPARSGGRRSRRGRSGRAARAARRRSASAGTAW